MAVGVIPDDGDAGTGERGIVASAHGVVPGTVVGLQLQSVAGDVPFQPFAEGRMGSCVEVDYVLRLFGLVVTPYHVEVEITLYLFEKRAVLYEMF